jgi:NAD(P)H-hydrate epimerase
MKILLRKANSPLCISIIVQMKIFTQEQIKEADEVTISAQGIASYELMNRVAQDIFDLVFYAESYRKICIVCGKGNNGGDGLALALLLHQAGYAVKILIVEHRRKASDDFIYQLDIIKKQSIPVINVNEASDFPLPLDASYMLVDALLGTGTNRALEGILKEAVWWMNAQDCAKISIDIPSGLPADPGIEVGEAVARVHQTYAIETPKLSCLLSDNFKYCGNLSFIDIRWSPLVWSDFKSSFYCIDLHQITQMYKPRSKNMTKHDLGFAQLVAGSKGKAGAAVIAAKACLRSGCGLTEVFAPASILNILQITVPEAMCEADAEQDVISNIHVNNRATAVGIGPGIGLHPTTRKAVSDFIQSNDKPIVIDADALNIMSDETSLLDCLEEKAILTPHKFEFDRLFGSSANEWQRIQKAQAMAVKYQIVIVLKGMYSAVALPNGEVHFSITGNASLAKGGSGDVLTGIITGLLAAGYDRSEAAILGVSILGLSAEKTVQNKAMESIIASEIIENIGHSFLVLQEHKRAIINH